MSSMCEMKYKAVGHLCNTLCNERDRQKHQLWHTSPASTQQEVIVH